jgi:hypothetical protein
LHFGSAMTPPLRREILTPSNVHALRILLAALGAGLISGGMILGLAPRKAEPVPVVVVPAMEPLVVHVAVAAPQTVEEPPSADEASLVFQLAGSSYVKLADLSGEDAEAMPRHGKLVTLDDEEGVYAVVAPVLDRDVPLAYRAWKERTVSVDGTCRTKIAGFAVVAQLIGDPAYAGDDAETWTPSSILEHGAPVLAARLEGCTGAGSVAVDADTTTTVKPEVTTDLSYVEVAKQLVLATEDAVTAEREWAEAEMEGTWYDDAATEWSTQLVRHPTTGARYLAVSASHLDGCGSPQILIWQLYRIGPAGQLVRERMATGEVRIVEQLIDVDNDGTFELIGQSWPGGPRYLVDADGDTLATFELPFYGCGC